MPKGSNTEEGKQGFQPVIPKKSKAPTAAIDIAGKAKLDTEEEIVLLSPGEKAYRKTYTNFKANRKLLRDRWLDREIDRVNRLIDSAENDNNYDDVVDYIRFTSHPGHTPDHDSLLESQSNGDYEEMRFDARYLASRIDSADGINYEDLPTNFDYGYDAYASLHALRTTTDLEIIDMIVASDNHDYTNELVFNPNLTREHLETILSKPLFAKSMWALLSNPLITEEFAKTFIGNCDSPSLLAYLAKEPKYTNLGVEALALASKRAEELRKETKVS